MSVNEVSKIIKNIVADYVDVEADKIDTKQCVSSEMGIDSFGLISMVGTIESEFGISIPDSALMNFQTIDDIVNYVVEVA